MQNQNKIEQAIAKDLNLCDMIMGYGNASAKAKATKQRKACFAQIKAMNKANGLDSLTDDELLSELTA